MKPSMPSRLGIISITIIILAIFSMSVIWPMGAFPVNQSSSASLEGARVSNPSNESNFIRQDFSPMYEDLQSISVYLSNDADSIDTMKCVFRLYDYTGKYFLEYFFQLEEIELPGYVKIPIDMSLSPGTLYFYTISGMDGELLTMYCNDENKTPENGALYYKEVQSPGITVATQYEYKRPMGFKRIMMSYALIAVITIGLLYAVNTLRMKSHKWEQIEAWFKRGLFVLIGIGVLVAFWGIVIRQLFTHSILNIVVLFLGVLIAAGLLTWGVYSCKGANVPLKEGEKSLGEKGISAVRGLIFAAVILFICLHNNAMTNYEKGLHLRCMLTCFGLFLVSFSSKKEIWNLPNLIWSVVAFVGGKYYVSLHSDHIEHINTAVRSAYVMWSMGLVAINFVYMIMKGKFKKLKNINIPYTILIYTFWIVCVIFANGKEWPLLLLVIFTLWNIKYITIEDKTRVLEEICNGILLAFIGSIIFCLYRRPYQYYMLTRYSGIYYTVTSTAIYLCVPLCAALIKTKKEKNLFGFVLFGIVSAYMAFTASRTGIIAAGITIIFIVFFPTKDMRKKWVLEKLKYCGTILLSILLGFIMSFSATRMLPAMVANPFYFYFEKDSAYMNKDTPWIGDENNQSVSYITVERSLEMLFGRLLIVDSEETKEAANYREGALLVSIGNDIALTEAVQTESTSIAEYSNGRTEIYEAYLQNLSVSGHNSMQLIQEDGNIIMHAHNTYIQTAYDFGIPIGIFFLCVCLYTFIRAIRFTFKNRNKNIDNCLPLAIVVAFGVASLFEWTYYICIPLGFMFLLMMAPLIVREDAYENK